MPDLIEEYKDKLPKPLLDEIKEEVKDRKISKEQLKKILDKVQSEYENAIIDPGESIGVITAESFGEPGTQMSILKNEKIILKIKDRIKILEIGGFVDKFIEKYGSMKFNNSDVLPLENEEIYVPSLNQEEKIEWKKITELSRHRTNKKLLKLTTKSGRSIVATDNHSFVTRKNNKVVPIVGSDLNVGDRIPVIKYLPENCIEEIDLMDYITQSTRFPIIEEEGFLIREGTISKPLPRKLELDKRLGWFIGAYLSEGNATHGQINISNMDNFFMNNVKAFLSNMLLDYKEVYHQRGFSLSRDLKINSSLLASFLINTCKTGSKNKKVPEFAYSAKEEFVSGLLKGYFDGNGNVHTDRKMIRISSNSKELIDGISLLLTRFRIFSHKIKIKKQYGLLIPYKYASLFLEKIGSNLIYKRKALEKLSTEAKKILNKSQDYTDMISGFDNLFYDVAKKLKMPTRYVNNFTKRQKIGRTALFRYMKKFELLSKEKNIDIKKELEIMNRMFNSDVIWDAIKKIEYVENNDYVYDLSVPGLETFTTSEGIVTHNTLNVKHFAGVAEMNVTLGLPRLIEIFDATKNPSTPAMEIYLKKEYAKDAKAVKKIAYRLKETVLEDVSSEFLIDVTRLCVKILLDKNKLRDLGVNEKDLIEVLTKGLRNVQIRANKNELVLKGKEAALNEVYALKEKARNTFISGVKKVTAVLPVKRGGEFVILTAGSNLKDVMAVKEVDNMRVITNDIHEVRDVLGIEAARQAIINESSKVITNQGLDVDIRHIMLIADAMTAKGIIRGITRTGMTGEKESVLARASFETPIRHLINAAMTGEVDRLNSVIENVILNQPVPVGTGLPDLIVTKVPEKEDKK
ncbi:MAG: DNA-directed RNA polymerase subunit A'' [Nanoarchaeota archaeon]|nr:DNA-directed RNA polymerase subunit A'' [Nanoarchaeota archaeon]